MNANGWLIDGHVAKWKSPSFSFVFDADQPSDGLVDFHVLDQPWPAGKILGIDGSIPFTSKTRLTDWYVRAGDLVAVYATGEPDAARLDLVWRSAGPAAGYDWLARIDLIVSLHTDRLDWKYDLCLKSSLPGVTAASRPGSVGELFKASDWSLAVVVPSADVKHQGIAVRERSYYQMRHPIFQAGRLERGVILRSRARAWFLPSQFDWPALEGCVAAFSRSDPPLGISAGLDGMR
jgi:hypothetical protein